MQKVIFFELAKNFSLKNEHERALYSLKELLNLHKTDKIYTDSNKEQAGIYQAIADECLALNNIELALTYLQDYVECVSND